MFRIRRKQFEAFQKAARQKTPERMQQALQQQGHNVERESTTGDLVGTDLRGKKSRLAFSEDGSPKALTTPTGLTYRFENDESGHLSAVDHPGGERLEFKRDQQGNITQVNRPGKQTYQLQYDEEGRLLAQRDPDNKTLHLTYDQGQLTRIVDRTGAATHYTRDQNGKLKGIVDPLGRQTSFQVDDQGELREIAFPDGTKETYKFDPEVGLVIQARDGQEIIQEIGPTGRIQSITWSDTSWIETDFDPNGNLVRAANENEEIFHTFDDKGNPLTEESAEGTVEYAYDPEGRITQLVTHFGEKLEYEYDDDGRLSVVRDWEGRENRIEYGPSGAVSKIRYGNGLVESQQQASVGRLQSAQVTDARGDLISSQSYAYDVCERLTRVSDSWGPTSRETFARTLKYDAESRLIGDIEANTNRMLASFAYDAKGNLISDNHQAIQFGLMDQPISYAASPIEYDALGNACRFPSEKGDIECRFSASSVLQEATLAGKTYQYEYDALCRRILKSDGESTWRYGWAGHQLIWEEFEPEPGADPILREYVFLPNSTTPIAFRENGKTYWLQADARGAIIRAFDEEGNVVWRATYDSFGQAHIEVEKVRQPWRLLGQYHDEETGLHYNFARYYHPQLKTYLSLDPCWSKYEASNYGYCQNNPWNRADPFGTLAPVLIGLGVVALGAAIGAGVAALTGNDPVAGAVEGGMTALGGVLGALGGPVGVLIGGFIGSTLGAFTGELVRQWRAGEEISMECAVIAAVVTGAIDLALLGLGKFPPIKALAKKIGDKLIRPYQKSATHFIRKLFSTKGIASQHMRRLKDYASQKGRTVILRAPNKESLQYHGKPGYKPKPVGLPKQAKTGEDGIVTWNAGKKKKKPPEGYTVEEGTNHLVDKNGNKLYSDYDMQGVYEPGAPGKQKKVVDMNDNAELDDINKAVEPGIKDNDDKFIQHGANDNYKKKRRDKQVMGRQPDPDETYVVIEPNGNSKTINSTAELQQYYKDNNMPWPYKNYQ